MSSFSIRCALNFYNFFSISNLKLRNGKFEVSYVLTLLNIVVLPVSLVVSHFVTEYSDIELYSEEVNAARVSKFSKISSQFLAIYYLAHSIFFYLIQIVNRHKISRLVNRAADMKLKTNFLNKFKKNCIWKSFLISFALLSLITVQITTIVKISIASFIIVVVLSYKVIVPFAFMSFVVNFEQFFVALLEEFRSDLKQYNPKNYQKHMKRFQEIYDLIEEFQSCFKHQFTATICAFLLNCVTTVSFLFL